MSISLEAPQTMDEVQAAALDLLRGKPNPFENLVRPQRRDGRFEDLDEPTLLQKQRELLQRLIDSYRLSEYRSVLDLPETRVVTVLGARGAGKTHMLEAIANRHGQILVRPTYFERTVPFEEYLLSQLASTLLSEERPFEAIAVHLTRRLLVQTIRGLGPTDRIFASDLSTYQRMRLLWHGGAACSARFDAFLRELTAPPAGCDVLEQAEQHNLSPALLLQLLEAHLQRREPADEVLSAVRRHLYLAMARATLLRHGDALGQFLEADYTPAGPRPFYRGDVVRQLLCALVEACALVRRPVVFAFDNLEGLLAPGDLLDAGAVRAFLDGLAQAVDSLRGLLFLLFAERGLHQQMLKQANQFALDRLQLGVPLHAVGLVDVVELMPPGREEIERLIAARMERMFRSLPNASALPAGFPFGAKFLEALAQKSDMGLRNKLRVLRDEYSRVVYGRGEPPQADGQPKAGETPDWQFHLAGAWEERLREAGRKLQGSLVAQRQDLHAGLGKVLQHAGPVSVSGWRLDNIEPLVAVGDSATHGVVTRLRWTAEAITAAKNGGPRDTTLAIGFLLASGRAMPIDLRAKFDVFQEKTRPTDYLIVLWPRETDSDDLVAALPPATRDVWKGARWQTKAELRFVPSNDLRVFVALPDWLEALPNLLDAAVPEPEIQAFVQKHCQAIFELVRPPVPKG